MQRIAAFLAFALFALVNHVAHAAGINDTALRLIYGDVTDWTHFAPPASIRRACADGLPLRIAYFTRHSGTLWDWIAVAAHLGSPWTRVNPGLFQVYGMNTSAAALQWRSVGLLMCRSADLLLFSDTIPDARTLLQGGCTTPLILQVTNRFDYGIQAADLPAYVALLAAATRLPYVWWVTNNPYEEEYLAKHGITLPADRHLLLRPVGACLLQPPQAPTAPPTGRKLAEARVALLLPPYSRHLENTFLLPWLLRHGLTARVEAYRQHYGGPYVLAQHRGVITVPYQTSVMKMYEGLAAGAVFIIPGPDLFSTMLRKLDPMVMSFCCRELIHDHPDDWQRFMDWYHDDFAPAHIMYDSMTDLRRIITDAAWSAALVEEKRRLGQDIMARSRRVTLEGFGAIVSEVGRQACNATTDQHLIARGMGREQP